MHSTLVSELKRLQRDREPPGVKTPNIGRSRSGPPIVPRGRTMRHAARLTALLMALTHDDLLGQDEGHPPHRSPYPVVNVHRHLEEPDERALRAEFEVMDRVGVRRIVILDGTWS